MLTGQRATEISALRWSELTDGAIVLPSEQTKNHRPHPTATTHRPAKKLDLPARKFLQPSA
jgi:hypothetical protein